MGLNHTEPAYTSKAAPLVRELGGKMGGLELVRQIPGLADHVLPSINVRSGEGLPSLAKVRALVGSRRVIARASDHTDMQGMAGVNLTRVVGAGDVPKTIEEIRTHARSSDVLGYGQYENPGYTGEISVGLQPHLKSRTSAIGSIVDHPNQPGNYVIAWRKEITQNLWRHGCAVYDGAGDKVLPISYWRQDDSAPALIAFHKKIRAAGIFPENISFETEFFDDPKYLGLYILQIRAFLEKCFAKFEVPKGEGGEVLSFGVTEGLTLPIVHLGLSEAWHSDWDFHDGWSLVRSVHAHPTKLSFRPQNMAAYLPSHSLGSGKPSLGHNHVRLIQKARVTIMEPLNSMTYDPLLNVNREDCSLANRPFLDEGPTGNNVHIICDGFRSVVKLAA